jgi:hypothetical protein
VPVSRTGDVHRTPGGFGAEAQEQLSRVFRRLADRKVHVLLSNSDVPAIRELCAPYRTCVISVATINSMHPDADRCRKYWCRASPPPVVANDQPWAVTLLRRGRTIGDGGNHSRCRAGISDFARRTPGAIDLVGDPTLSRRGGPKRMRVFPFATGESTIIFSVFPALKAATACAP